MKTYEEVHAVLEWFWREWESLDGVIIPVGNDGIKVSASLNDVFYWACADAEEITPDDLPALDQAKNDCHKIEPYSWCNWGLWLWACRKRKTRPMDCWYDKIPIELHPLFDAAGPERERTTDNHPGKVHRTWKELK